MRNTGAGSVARRAIAWWGRRGVGVACGMVLATACGEGTSLPPEPAALAVPAPASMTQSSLGVPVTASRAEAGTQGLFARSHCAPEPGYISPVNLAANPDFEQGISGTVSWPPGPTPVPSAATGWLMHSDNTSSPISSRLIPSTVPGKAAPGRMLAFRATKNESGINQVIAGAPAKVMFSAWVYVVTKGAYVQLTVNGSGNTPAAHTTSFGEWEQLRVCSDGTVPAGLFTIWQQSANGGTFFVDRVQIRELY